MGLEELTTVIQFWILDFAESCKEGFPPWQTFQDGFWIDPSIANRGFEDFGFSIDYTAKRGACTINELLVI
ncbi:hypothetical protein FDUTEX481_05896 [Tolypothrix sp. PCC 7601]|nr:hypothetical protein FDUTEX481_05896 [Tolypothrix sp. PCC 7601]